MARNEGDFQLWNIEYLPRLNAIKEKGRFPWKPSPPWGHCWQQHFQRSQLDPHRPVSFQKIKLKAGLVSGLWLSNGKLLCIFLHLRAGGKCLDFRLLSPNSIYFPMPHLPALNLRCPFQCQQKEKQTGCWACKELQTPNIGSHGKSWSCLLPPHSAMPSGSVCWSATFLVSICPKASLPSPLDSLLPQLRDCPPCPEVMSVLPLPSKISSSLSPRSASPTFPSPSSFKM